MRRVCVFVCVCKFLHSEDQTAHLTCKVRTFGLVTTSKLCDCELGSTQPNSKFRVSLGVKIRVLGKSWRIYYIHERPYQDKHFCFFISF